MTTAIIFLNVKRTRTPGLKMAAVKIQNKFKFKFKTRYVSMALGLRPRAILKTSGTVFPNTDLPAGK